MIEGLDGSGKSTQVSILKRFLHTAQIPFKQIKLPDYDDPSSTLVQMYLAGKFGENPGDVNAYAASSFYAVDRYASFKQHWQTDYQNGTLILADRYTSSNAVHQASKLPQQEWDAYLDWLYDYEFRLLGIPKPNKVIFLDMPPSISQKLMSHRYQGDEKQKDIHERDVDYLEHCRAAALYAAQKLNWDVVQCFCEDEPLAIETIAKQIESLIKPLLFENDFEKGTEIKK